MDWLFARDPVLPIQFEMEFSLKKGSEMYYGQLGIFCRAAVNLSAGDVVEIEGRASLHRPLFWIKPV